MALGTKWKVSNMMILVSYDVRTEAAAGRRRLRRVARVCLNYGQRVQKSVFECRVNQAQYEALERALLAEIDLNEDNLRFYRLTEPLAQHVKEFGMFRAVDFENESLVV
jgi:CRISPR-associated protein Cas2